MQAYQGGDLLGSLVLAQWVSKVTANCNSSYCASLKSQANGFAYSITNNLDSAGNTPTYTYINQVRPHRLYRSHHLIASYPAAWGHDQLCWPMKSGCSSPTQPVDLLVICIQEPNP